MSELALRNLQCFVDKTLNLCYTEFRIGGEKMRKETITVEAVRQDFFRIVNFQIYNKKRWRLSYIIPTSILAVAAGMFAGMFFASIFVGLLFFQ